MRETPETTTCQPCAIANRAARHINDGLAAEGQQGTATHEGICQGYGCECGCVPETPETTMRPEDVPEELAAILERAIYAMPRIELTRTIARVALAAVLPAHKAMVSAKVAEDAPRAADMVAKFHAAMGDEPGELRTLPGPNVRDLRTVLLAEEYDEYIAAVDARDVVAIADALADMAYVLYGTAYTYGIPLDDVLAEVHRSNMTKDFTTEPGQKIRKGPDYSPPDIAAVLARGEQP